MTPEQRSKIARILAEIYAKQEGLTVESVTLQETKNDRPVLQHRAVG